MPKRSDFFVIQKGVYMRRIFFAWVIAGLFVSGCQQQRDLTIGSWVEVSIQGQTAIGLLVNYEWRITDQRSILYYHIDFGEDKRGERDSDSFPKEFIRPTKVTTTFLQSYLESKGERAKRVP
jgi:hypothetical protein